MLRKTSWSYYRDSPVTHWFSLTFLYPVCIFRPNSFSEHNRPPPTSLWIQPHMVPPNGASGQAGQTADPVRSCPAPVMPGDEAQTVSWAPCWSWPLCKKDGGAMSPQQRQGHPVLPREENSYINVQVHNFHNQENNIYIYMFMCRQ